MGNLILCHGKEAKHPYYVKELGLRLYTGEELSYFIYHNLMLIEDGFVDDRLLRFIDTELEMPRLAEKLTKWKDQAALGELLLVILQDIHYFSSQEMQNFQTEVRRISKQSRIELLKEKADCMLSLGKYYDAIHAYDRLLLMKDTQAANDEFRGSVYYNKGVAMARCFSYEEAADCFTRAYDLMRTETPLRSLYMVHMMDSTGSFSRDLISRVSEEKLEKWQQEYFESRSTTESSGISREVRMLMHQDQRRRTMEMKRLLENWKTDFRRCQG